MEEEGLNFDVPTQPGSLEPWEALLTKLKERAPALVLSGHGAPGGPEVLDETLAYLAAVKPLIARAQSRAELERTVFAAFPERKGPFLVEISGVILFRDRAR